MPWCNFSKNTIIIKIITPSSYKTNIFTLKEVLGCCININLCYLHIKILKVKEVCLSKYIVVIGLVGNEYYIVNALVCMVVDDDISYGLINKCDIEVESVGYIANNGYI